VLAGCTYRYTCLEKEAMDHPCHICSVHQVGIRMFVLAVANLQSFHKGHQGRNGDLRKTAQNYKQKNRLEWLAFGGEHFDHRPQRSGFYFTKKLIPAPLTTHWNEYDSMIYLCFTTHSQDFLKKQF